MKNVGELLTSKPHRIVTVSPDDTVLEAIKTLGTQNVFVASDSGLVGTPNHPDALAMAAKSLRAAGFSEQDLNRMFKETPARLVGLPVQ